MANLNSFYQGETYKFSVTISVGGVAQNITSDTVRYILKSDKTDADAAAAVNVLADVATNGASGKANVTVTASQSDITPGKYYYEIIWTTGTEEYVLDSDAQVVLERVQDV